MKLYKLHNLEAGAGSEDFFFFLPSLRFGVRGLQSQAESQLP
jgi:hypothetical protein